MATAMAECLVASCSCQAVGVVCTRTGARGATGDAGASAPIAVSGLSIQVRTDRADAQTRSLSTRCGYGTSKSGTMRAFARAGAAADPRGSYFILTGYSSFSATRADCRNFYVCTSTKSAVSKQRSGLGEAQHGAESLVFAVAQPREGRRRPRPRVVSRPRAPTGPAAVPRAPTCSDHGRLAFCTSRTIHPVTLYSTNMI